MRLLPIIVAAAVTLAIAIGVFRVSYGYFVSEEAAKAKGRLSLYQSTVNAELERFSHLTYVLSRDTYVLQTLRGGETKALNSRLKQFAMQAGLDAIYLMDASGNTVATSNYADDTSYIGQNYAFRPYFQHALTGRQGRFYAIGATTGLPGYFIADAVRGVDGKINGVMAIKIGFSPLEDSWRKTGEQILLSNEDGVVLLSSDPKWRYRMLVEITEEQRQKIASSQQFPGQSLEILDWTTLPEQRAKIAGVERMHLTARTTPHGWTLHYFASDDQAVARSWLVTSMVVLLAGLALIVVQVQRARRVANALRRSEQEELTLRKANERLAIEITERNTAERRLQRTEQELERASRLAALGQLSASVTHELGQPIAAMRNHLAAAELGGEAKTGAPDTLFGKIGGLVDRMEGITRQLKFFARSGSEEFMDVDLRDAMRAALVLVEPNLTEFGVTAQMTAPDTSVFVRGSGLRLEQVMTNLLRNAIDAVEDSPEPEIRIGIGVTDEGPWFEISDNGHGLGAATLADLQEPFVSTRESGRGMGLGLTISAGIINDHGGMMTARNLAEGGAVFVVTFPDTDQEDA